MGVIADLLADAEAILGELGEVIDGKFSTSISSTAISHVTYDIESEELEISFAQGGSGTYTFYNVPVSVVVGLVTASSPGRYYNSTIRGVYV